MMSSGENRGAGAGRVVVVGGLVGVGNGEDGIVQETQKPAVKVRSESD